MTILEERRKLGRTGTSLPSTWPCAAKHVSRREELGFGNAEQIPVKQKVVRGTSLQSLVGSKKKNIKISEGDLTNLTIHFKAIFSLSLLLVQLSFT